MQRFLTHVLSILALAWLTACAAPPEDLDLALTHTTDAKRFVVTVQPPAPPAAVNQIHSWTLRLTPAAGQTARPIRITVDGGMPQHGHGLPTQPQVADPLPDGSYVIEGMKFSMTGWWEIKLTILSEAGTDKVTFNTIVQ